MTKNRYRRIMYLVVCVAAICNAYRTRVGETPSQEPKTPVTESQAGMTAGLAKAADAYSKGDYEKSVAEYLDVEKKYGYDAALLFNLGNAYYKSGDDGHAMVCYQRARLLDPGDDRINDNIQFLSSRVEDLNKAELKGKKGNVSPDPLTFFRRAQQSITSDVASDNWAFFAGMAFVLLLFAVAIYLFTPSVRLQKLGFFSGIILFIFSLIFVTFAIAGAHRANSHDEAVLVSFKTPLLEEPLSGSRSISVDLHRGTLFDIIETQKGPDGKPQWYKVRLNSENIGWLEASAIEVI